jgi:hypothetical protein
MRRAAFIAGVLVFALTGCGKTYKFDLAVTVTNDADGSPIAGATIHRNMWGEKSDPKTPETVLRTDAAGQVSEQLSVSDTAFGAGKPTWYLRVSRDGFEPEIVEFKPAKPPADAHTRLEVPIKLRPVKR